MPLIGGVAFNCPVSLTLRAEGGGRRKRDSGCFLSPGTVLCPKSLWPQDWRGEWREATSVALIWDVSVCPEEGVTHGGVPGGQPAPVEDTAAARAGGILGRRLTAALAAAAVFSHIPRGMLRSGSPE